MTCDEESEACCVDESSLSCGADYCAANVRLRCDDSVDCPGERCCYTNISASAAVSTFCSADCGNTPEQIQVCGEAGDCENGDSCHAFVCGNTGATNITLGLCTETAPMFCE